MRSVSITINLELRFPLIMLDGSQLTNIWKRYHFLEFELQLANYFL